jgi:sugar phosphate isomerase/epimerase
MKNILLVVWFSILFGCSAQEKKKELDNTFYPFNNAMRLPNAPKGMDEQAEIVKNIGYPAIGGHTGDDYFARRASLDKAGLKMPELYYGFNLAENGEISYKEGLKEIIKDSKDRDLLVALFLDAKSFTDNKEEGDPLIAKGIQELADFAADYNVKIAIYPHVNNYCEESAHSVKLAKLVDRKNVGVIFNTCHFLKVEGDKGWEEKLLIALPYLYMVSIHGADAGNTKEMDWDRLIQPLGEGTFDVYGLVKLLKENGYNGLFGLQCYNIQQDFEVALTRSMLTWKEYQKKYAAAGE